MSTSHVRFLLAGLPVLLVTQELNRIAGDTGGQLRVSEDGEITYVFDPRFEQSYVLRGTSTFFRRAGRVIWNALMFVANKSANANETEGTAWRFIY